MLGLVLTAGGARGAYQAGVLRRIGETPSFRARASPFAVVTGASAGAINGMFLAARSREFVAAVRDLTELWARLSVRQVFRTDLASLGCVSMRWLRDLSLGGILGGGSVSALLDTAPLYELLRDRLHLEGIGESIAAGHLFAAAVSATSYHSGRSFTFVQGRSGHPLWTRARRVALSTEITHEHVSASAAIPIVFPPVRIRTSAGGECFFGDGALRLVAPLSPAIRLGATRVFAIGVRCSAAAAALQKAELPTSEPQDAGGPEPTQPPMAQICGVFLNALFLDHLDADLDHLLRMNEIARAHGPSAMPLAEVTPLVVSPSADLALVAAAFAHKMPRAVRYVMEGLGTPDAQSADLMSYLLFDSTYTRALIDIGYHDAAARIDEIEEFLLGGDALCRSTSH
jgi:NTE family protein